MDYYTIHNSGLRYSISKASKASLHRPFSGNSSSWSTTTVARQLQLARIVTLLHQEPRLAASCTVKMTVAAYRVIFVAAALLVALTSAETAVVDSEGGVQVAHACLDRRSTNSTMDYKSILADNHRYCDHVDTKSFAGESLVYVTPWNNHGYDVAKIFAAKFTYVSPCWLQARVEAGRGVVITGTHDIDQGWLADVRKVCARDPERCPAIVPRVNWEIRDSDKAVQQAAVEAIVAAVLEHGFDGVVLECPLSSAFRSTIRKIAAALHAKRRPAPHSDKPLVLIQVLPPGGLRQEEFLKMSAYVDRFSLMTYDYSVHRGNGDGPNAPIGWVNDTARALVASVADGAASPQQYGSLAKKILLGLAFYGYDHGEAITYGKYLQLLKDKRPRLKWDPATAEHSFSYMATGKMRRTVHYPTLHSVAARLDLAEEIGTGISIWEIGQGLDYWYDLL